MNPIHPQSVEGMRSPGPEAGKEGPPRHLTNPAPTPSMSETTNSYVQPRASPGHHLDRHGSSPPLVRKVRHSTA